MKEELDYNEQVEVRIEKLKEYENRGINAYNMGYEPNYEANLMEHEFEKFTKEELEENISIVSIAGRVMTKRGQGKAGFATIKDPSGEIQIYASKDNLTEDEFFIWSKIDIGDIIFAEGEVMKTKVGALAVRVKKLVMLTKSLRPLPEKYHGLTDKEERYRRRYLDLMVNEETHDTFVARSKIISKIRTILSDENFLEVETPVLQTLPGGASASPFITHHNTLDMEMYLRIAPELYLKKLVVGGLPRVYEIGKQFRNEGISIKHNPEFTSLELYQMYGDMHSMMDITEKIIQESCLEINDSLHIKYEKDIIDLSNFTKVHMVDLIQQHTGINFFEIYDTEEAIEVAKKFNVEIADHHQTIGHIINEFFEQLCEEKLMQPTFVYGHPLEISPLSAVNQDDPRFTDRFELFIGTREYANAFTELNDPIDQLKRFKAQDKERELGNDEAHEIDYDFIEALEYGLAPTGGLGIGIDRLVMLLTNRSSIKDVIFFPTMKPKN